MCFPAPNRTGEGACGLIVTGFSFDMVCGLGQNTGLAWGKVSPLGRLAFLDSRLSIPECAMKTPYAVIVALTSILIPSAARQRPEPGFGCSGAGEIQPDRVPARIFDRRIFDRMVCEWPRRTGARFHTRPAPGAVPRCSTFSGADVFRNYVCNFGPGPRRFDLKVT